MDIQHLVDRLEDLIDEGRHMPFSKFTMIDEERALELIDQMRISIPEEIEKASRVLAQRDRILAQANEEAARIVKLAREKGEQMIDREPTVQAAQGRAVNLIEQARNEAEGVMSEADQYVLEVLVRLEQNLVKALREVRAGMNEVNPPTTAQPPVLQAPPAEAQPAAFIAPAIRPSVEVGAHGDNA